MSNKAQVSGGCRQVQVGQGSEARRGGDGGVAVGGVSDRVVAGVDGGGNGEGSTNLANDGTFAMSQSWYGGEAGKEV